MTRKDFEALAGVIRDEFAHTNSMYYKGIIDVEEKVGRDVATVGIRRRLIDLCKATNPRFDEARFVNATET